MFFRKWGAAASPVPTGLSRPAPGASHLHGTELGTPSLPALAAGPPEVDFVIARPQGERSPCGFSRDLGSFSLPDRACGKVRWHPWARRRGVTWDGGFLFVRRGATRSAGLGSLAIGMLQRGLLSSVGDEQEWRLPDWHQLRLMAVRRWNESGLGFNAEMGQIQCRKRGIASASARGACLYFVPSFSPD